MAAVEMLAEIPSGQQLILLHSSKSIPVPTKEDSEARECAVLEESYQLSAFA